MGNILTKLKPWLLATRPKTLPASIVPVMIGTASACAVVKIDYLIMTVTMICAVLIQIITNYINEIYDFKKGADKPDRIGPQRMVASGVISSLKMTIAVTFLLIITFLLGLILVNHSDINILYVGILSLLFAWFYTGGPFPLAYKGLGDIFVFIFFGLIAVCGTYYVQVHTVSIDVLIASLAPGFLSMNILGINNFRDIDSDRKVGKITLSVRIGRRNSIILYEALMLFSYITPIVLLMLNKSYFMLLPMITIPLAIKLIKEMKTKSGSELNNTLAGTGKLLMIYGILSSIGFVISNYLYCN